jgi:hypothetical protein
VRASSVSGRDSEVSETIWSDEFLFADIFVELSDRLHEMAKIAETTAAIIHIRFFNRIRLAGQH